MHARQKTFRHRRSRSTDATAPVGDDASTGPPVHRSATSGAPHQTGTRFFDFGFLDDLLGYTLRRAQLAVFANFAQTMAAFEISPGQLGALALIQANAGLKQTALGEALGIKRASVVPLLDRLGRRGLIVRAKPPGDRRSHALMLTAAGQRLLSEIRPRLQEHEQRIAADLTDDERQLLRALLRRIRAWSV